MATQFSSETDGQRRLFQERAKVRSRSNYDAECSSGVERLTVHIPRRTYVLLYSVGMTEIAITDARGRLASIIDTARRGPVYLTRRNRPVAAIIDADQLNQLLADADELADIRAVDAAWKETQRLGETPIPWEDVKRDLGLS